MAKRLPKDTTTWQQIIKAPDSWLPAQGFFEQGQRRNLTRTPPSLLCVKGDRTKHRSSESATERPLGAITRCLELHISDLAEESKTVSEIALSDRIMERSTPVRKPHASTADLLTWSENPLEDCPANGSSSRPVRNVQPSDGISKVVFGGQVTDEEVENLLKSARKPCSNHKLREMTGSGIFAADGENDSQESEGANANPSNRTGLRMYQQAVAGISQISFAAEEGVSPKKPTTLPEVAKQRELSGNLDSASDANMKKQLSDAKCKELSGHGIFGPPENLPQTLPTWSGSAEPREKEAGGLASYNVGGGQNLVFGEEPVMKTAKKIYNQKFAQLSGNDIFMEDTLPKSAEKPLSVAKLREISGNDIFADGKVESRDYLGGVRKPPGGESSIALV